MAKAGPDQTVAVGANIILNGSASSDVDGDPLTYLWAFVSRPANSTADLFGIRSVSPTFVADKAGEYKLRLVVNDGKADSSPSIVTITTANTKPVASASGPSQPVNFGALVQLNGAGSSDADGDPLTYRWSLITVPSGSTAAISNPVAVNPTFTADLQGSYVAQLIVNDGKMDSDPSTVAITTSAPQTPTANAGPDQTVMHGALVTLSGSGTDPQGLPLTLLWSLITRPEGSQAVLSSTSIANPTFVADKPGDYVAQLVVSNQFLSSAPKTIKITTTNTTPVADAGTNQNVAVGTTVQLDASSSHDADHDPLSYSWSFNSRPAGSTTVLMAANGKMPTFFADSEGTYVVQLIVNDGFTNSTPSTVTVTATTMKITLSPSPLNLFHTPGTLTVSLGAPAPAPDGLTVTLSGFDPSVISVPASVVVPANSTGVNVTVTPLAAGSTSILAMATGYQPGTAAVTVTTPAITLTSSLTAVALARSIDATITLGVPAPAGDAVIALSASGSGGVTFDSQSVTIPVGSSTGTFKITGSAEGQVTITATSASYVSGTLGLLVVSPGAIVVPTGVTVAPGRSVPLNVSLATPAPVDGVTITLTSSDTSILTVSPSLFIPQGATTPQTAPQVTGVALGSATVAASAPGFQGDSQTVKVGVTLSFSAQAVTVGVGGVLQNLDILLSAPAPAGGLTVNLNSSNTAIATVPGSVTINQNASSANVPVTGVAGGGPVTITASSTAPNVAGASTTVMVVTYGSIVLPANVSLGLGQSAAFPIALSGPAPQGGVTVTLSTSDAGKVDISPKTVAIDAGQTLPASQPQVTGVNLGSAVITASAPGFGSSTYTVQATASLSFSPQDLSLGGVESKNLTLTLSGPAPPGGLAVNISAVPAGVVTVPASVTVAQNTTTATVAVTGVAQGTATITATAATAPNVSNATATATVLPAGAITLPANVTVPPGQAQAFAVTLTSPAPQGGTTVTLSTSDSGVVSLSTTSVPIDAGQTHPTTQPQITGGNFGSATISASAPGFTSASQSVKVGASLSFSAPTVMITGPDTQNLTLTLSAPAPAPLVVNLSATPANIVTIPPSVTIAQNATTATVAVTGAGAGTTTLTASTSAPNVSNATSNITVQIAGALSLPSGVSLGLGQVADFQVTLPAPAPQPVTVTLSSSDPAKVDIAPATVTIPANATQPAAAPRVTGKDLGTANITATAPVYTSVTKIVQVTGTISFAPATLTVSGTETKNLTLTLSGPTAAGMTFNLNSSNPSAATVPSTAAIPANGTTVTVPVTGVAAGATIIRASAANLADATANVTVVTAVDIIVPASLTVAPGDSVVFPITLSKSAPSTVFLDITSSDPSKATPSSGSVQIVTGQTQSATLVRINGIAAGTVTITVKSNGVNLAQATSAVTVAYAVTLSPPDLSITGYGNPGLLTLSLSGPAPAPGGLDFSLSSSDTHVVTVPSSANMPAGWRTMSVRITSVSAGSAVIHVSAPGVPEATINITVLPPGSISLSGINSIGLSQTAPLTVTLTTPAPSSGVTVTLNSSDPETAIVPASVDILPGAQTPATPPQLTAHNVGPATITASAPGFTAATPLTIQVTATVTWTNANPLIISGSGKQAFVTLRLSATAPTGDKGVVVNLLSSNPGAATIQPTGVFLWDGSNAPTINIPVTSVASGTTTIHASGTNIPDATTTVTVISELTITSNSLPGGTVGAAYTGPAMTVAGGTSPYHWSATGLPTGLNMDANTGVISGTTAQAGTFTVAVQATDSATPPQSVTKNLSLTMGVALKIDTTSLPDGIAGKTYTSPAMSASGGTSPYHWSATGLPTGLGMDANTGVIAGITSQAGTATVVVQVTDSATSPQSVTKNLSLTIAPQLAITTTALPDGIATKAYTGPAMAATGGTGAYHWLATGLPANLTMDANTGVIGGTPAQAGTTMVTVRVTDSATPTPQTITKDLILTIAPLLTITTTSLPNGAVNTAYTSPAMGATGGTGAYHWLATGLPTGLTMSATTGVISGTTSQGGTVTVTVQVTDSGTPTAQSVTKDLSLTITTTTLSISTASLPDGIATKSYTSPAMVATGGTPGYHWSATGLPAGLTMDANTGVISGTTSQTGTATVAVQVTDSASSPQTANKNLSLTIAPLLVITTSALPDGLATKSYTSPAMAATGGTGAYHWSATGLPTGLTMNATTGVVSGTTSQTGTATVAVQVTDSAASPQTATRNLSLTIAPLLTITTTSLPAGAPGTAYTSPAMTATGGTGAYHWSATGLPNGLTMNAATGVISGTTSQTGTATVAVTVTDSAASPQTDTKNLSLTISVLLTINTTSLPAGVAGTAYTSPAMSASGGTGAYHWSATGLPTGLTMNATTGVITGTTSQTGTATVAVQVTDSATPTPQSATRNLSLTISPLLTINTTSLPNGVAGTAYTSPVMSANGGTGTYQWSATGLPTGLTMNAITGVISGTTSQTGTATVAVQVTDSATPPQVVTRNLSLNILPALAITTSALPDGVATKVYTSPAMAATGGTGAYHWSATGLPTGLTMNATTGVITGTTSQTGTATVAVQVTDSATPTPQSATKNLSLNILPVLAIATSALPDGVATKAYTSPAMAATGGTGAYHWSATGLPTGLTMNATTGVITGTTSQTGTATVAVQVTDSATPTPQSATRNLSLTIAPLLTITTTTLPDGVANKAYTSPAMAATGGTGAYHWSATGLPTGLTMNATTGVISGTTTQTGTVTVAVQVSDSAASPQTATQNLSLTIQPPLTITTTALPDGIASKAYTGPAMAATGGTPAYHWSATGLPTGLTMDANTGVISGTTTQTGTATVVVQVADSTTPTAQTATKNLSLTIAPLLTIITSTLPDGVATKSYTSPAMAATGGTGAYHWSATGLPTGLTMNATTGVISGTTAQTGTVTVAVTVTDSAASPQSDTKSLALKIAPALTITTATLPGGIASQAYTSPAMAATGGTGTYHWSATGLPTGLTMNATTGVISGATAQTGTATVAVTVTDSATSPQSDTKSLSLTIVPLLTITTNSLPAGTAGVDYSSNVAATGGTGAYHWSASNLPTGLSIDANTGTISGYPTQPGTKTVTVQVTDSATPTAQIATKDLALTLAQPPALAINTTSLPNATAGVAYIGPTMGATGGIHPYHWTAVGLPTSFTMDVDTGVIRGTATPAQAGTVNLLVTVADSATPSAQSVQKSLSFTIVSATVTITTTALTAGAAGANYSFTPAASGGTTPYTWNITGLPRGLAFVPNTGLISGKTSYSGTFQIGLEVTDSSTSPQHATKTLPLTMAPATPALAITTGSLPAGSINVAYTTTVNATGGILTYTWSATGLPTGMQIDPSTGVISGTVTTAFSNSVTITVTDSSIPAQTASTSLNLTITGGSPAPSIVMSNVSVGTSLQTPLTISFSPAPTTDFNLTVTANTPGLVKFGSLLDDGQNLIDAVIPAGTTSISTYIKAFGPTGSTVNLTASVPNFTNGTSTVTITKSGFVLSSPGGVGATVDTFWGVNTPLTVFAARLSSSDGFVEAQQLRSGLSVSVPIYSTQPSIGDVGSSTVGITGGTASSTVQFVASTSNTGGTEVILDVPPNFTLPAAGANKVTVNVSAGGCIPFNATVGKNLQTTANISLNARAASPLSVRLHSSDGNKLKFACIGTACSTGCPHRRHHPDNTY